MNQPNDYEPENSQNSHTYITGVNVQGIDKSYSKKKSQITKRPQTSLKPVKKQEIITNEDYDRKGDRKVVNKLYKKILFEEPEPGYYDKIEELYHISPGVSFIKGLFSHDYAMKAINHLFINIPESYWNDTEMTYVYNYKEDHLAMIKNDKDFKLYDTLLEIEEKQYQRTFEPNDPFIVIRNKGAIKVEKFGKVEDNLGKDAEGLVQRYIRCRGKNRNLLNMNSKPRIPSQDAEKAKQFDKSKSRIMEENKSKEMLSEELGNQFNKKGMPNYMRDDISPDKDIYNKDDLIHTFNDEYKESPDGIESKEKMAMYSDNNKNKQNTKDKKPQTRPSIVRLEYKTGYNTDKGCNVAYCLSNVKTVEANIRGNIQSEIYSELTTLNTDKEGSFYIYIMSGESVKPYEFYAKQLVTYIQKYFKILLKTIVLDFIRDERGIIYFLGCKQMITLKSPFEIEKNKLLVSKLPSIKDEDNIKKFYKTWTCSLCLLPYPKAKITKIVTFKLLYKLKENLNKRGCNVFDHIKNNDFNESQSCRVCDLCYTLLVTEQELMEIQKTIALCANIEVPNDELLNNESKVPEGLVPSVQKYNQLTQWRIIFYFLKFYFFDYSKFPYEDGSQLPSNATPSEKKKGKTNYKLYITLFNQKIAIPIFTEMKQFISKDEVQLNCAKIFYFFSSENSNTKQILKNEEVDFRIVLNDNFNEPMAHCKTTLFSVYEDDNEKEKTITSKMILNFFSDYIKHFKCQMYIGLKKDGLVQTENLQMYCYKPNNPIFITDLDYYSYHSLPSDWYELFIPPDTKIETDSEHMQIEELIDNIINQMEGKEKKKKKISNEDDEVYDPYDLLVKIQNKNDIINKIESLPIVLDKDFIEMKQEEKKERPKTSKLKEKYDFTKNNYNSIKPKKVYGSKKCVMDDKINENNNDIKNVGHEQLDDLFNNMNKKLDGLI